MIARPGTLILTAAIVALVAAVLINVPQHVHEIHWMRKDRRAYSAWVRANGGHRAYGIAVIEPHSRYDVVCAPHYPTRHHTRADYKIYLLVDSHGSRTPRVVRAVGGPLKPKPTDTGPKCGKPPPAP